MIQGTRFVTAPADAKSYHNRIAKPSNIAPASAARAHLAGGDRRLTNSSAPLPRNAFQSIVEGMATMTAPAVESADLAGGISKRVLRLLEAQVEDWHDVCRHLTDWEDRYLLDQPSPERLAEHARLLAELERVGTWMSLATGSSDFPDRPTAELVAMTLQDLKDARALWHGNMTRERRQEILRAVFNEP